MSATRARRSGQRRARKPAVRLFSFDRSQDVRRVAGVDEAGRGCLAGPLVVAAVCIDLDAIRGRPRRQLSELDDSKRLTQEQRERLFGVVMTNAECVAVQVASPRRIDADGLHRTNLRLMVEALRAVEHCAERCLVDGFHLGQAAPEHIRVVGGDRRSASIAAASVVAKVTRDRLMSGPMASAHPEFGFDKHVGYATPEHHAAIRRHGPSSVHRMSFDSLAYRGAPPALESAADVCLDGAINGLAPGHAERDEPEPGHVVSGSRG